MAALEQPKKMRPEKGRDCLPHSGGEPRTKETDELDTMSEASFATAASQGYRTEDEEVSTFEVSMVQLGWQNDELISDRCVRIEDQPAVRVIQPMKQEEDHDSGKDRKASKEDHEKKQTMVYCVTGLPMSKQQALVDASFQLRSRLLETIAFTFSAMEMEAILVDVAYVTALSQQEVPDYFAGPAMAKTVTQETRVVFGPEQEEWKAGKWKGIIHLHSFSGKSMERGMVLLPQRAILLMGGGSTAR